MRHIFTSTGESEIVKANDPVNISVSGLNNSETLQASFVGTIVLERRFDRDEGVWKAVAQFTQADTNKFLYATGEFYRFRCSAYTSGKIECVLSE